MYISWHGLSAFRIQSKEKTLLVDPFPASTGLAAPRMTADVILFSSPIDPLADQARKNGAFVIDAAGEYEVGGIVVTGLNVVQDNGKKEVVILTTITAEDVIIGHLGRLHREFTEDQIALLKDVDVLLVPVGGNSVLSAKAAMDMISRVEPRIVIPYYYHVAGMKEKADDLSAFLKEMGKKDIEPQEKFRITKKELPDGDMQLVILKP